MRVLAGEHDRREVGGAEQGPAHLLQHHDELDVTEPLAAVLLGDDQGLQSHLLGPSGPQTSGSYPRSVSISSRTAAPRRDLSSMKAADELAKLFLFFTEGEVHNDLLGLERRTPSAYPGPDIGARVLMCTRVLQSGAMESVPRGRVGIRELRNDVAAVVRRAGGGETVDRDNRRRPGRLPNSDRSTRIGHADDRRPGRGRSGPPAGPARSHPDPFPTRSAIPVDALLDANPR